MDDVTFWLDIWHFLLNNGKAIVAMISGGGVYKIYHYIKSSGADEANLQRTLSSLQDSVDNNETTLKALKEVIQGYGEALEVMQEQISQLQQTKEDTQNNTRALDKLSQKLEDLIEHLNGFDS